MPTLKAMFRLFDGYSSTIDKVNRKTDQAEKKILGASGATDKFNSRLAATGASAGSASSGIQRLIGAVVSLAAVQKGMGIADEYVNTAARLDLINDGLQTQAQLQDKIFAAADRSRGVYSDMARAVSKLQLLAGDAFGSNDEAIAFTELMQKSFKVGGASAQDQSSAMLQLTQAMASGRLQGDEYRAISEAAPLLLDAISKYTGKSKGELKEMSAEGVITADIIKNAMFMMSDDINSKFKTMPMTFADIWNRIRNGATKAFKPIIEKVSKIINSDDFKKFIDDLIGGLHSVARIADGALTGLGKLYDFVKDKWSALGPIVKTVASAWVAYNVATGIATAAQWALNVAMLANPVGLVVAAIAGLIALYYVVIDAVNQFAGTSINATGAIAGAFLVVLTLITNIFNGLWNLVVDVVVSITNLFGTLGNFIGNVFSDPIGSIMRLFVGLADFVLGVIQSIVGVLDMVFGSKLADSVQGWRDSMNGWVNEKYGVGVEYFAKANGDDWKKDRISYSDAWDTGYTWGEGLFSGVGNGLADILGGSDPLTIEGLGPGGSVKVDMSDEDIKYLRDLAEREYINKFSTATLAPNITVQFGDVHQTADADKVAKRIRMILREEIAVAAEGAYA